MIGIPEASAAIGSIKAAFGIAQGISALKSEAEVNQAVIAIQRTLLEAQSAALTDKEAIADLHEQISMLRAELAGRDAWEAEQARYVLTESALGAFTYNLRPELANGEAPHRLCVTCFSVKKKSVLHTTAKHSGGEIVHCGMCKTDLTLSSFNNRVRTIRNEMY